MVVDAEQIDNAVDDKEAKLARRKVLHQVEQILVLELAVARSRGGDVVISHLRIDAKALGNLCNAFGAERAFGVYVKSAAVPKVIT